MAIEVKKIDFSGKAFKEFLLFPWQIYQNDSHWVPPLLIDQKKILNPHKNPFFEHSEAEIYGAYGNGKLVGRIVVGINNNSNKFRNEKVAFFGFFESYNRPEVSMALFELAAEWAKKKGMKVLRGPFNLTINDEAGLLVSGFDSDPYVMLTHNPPYYERLILNAGLKPAMDAYSYFIEDSAALLTEPLLQLANDTKKKFNPVIRSIDTGKNFLRDAHIAMDMVNESLSSNWGAVPMTDREIEFKAKDLKVALIPDLCFFVEVNGKTVGFSLTLPNFNEAIKKANGRLFPLGLLKILYYSKKIGAARTVQLGMIKEYQKTGLGAYCYVEIVRRAKKHGFHRGEMSWILSNNKPMVNAAELLGAKRYKTYRWFEKGL